MKAALGPDAECTIAPAPHDSVAPGAAAAVQRRRACKDAPSSGNLLKAVTMRKMSMSSSAQRADSGASGASASSLDSAAAAAVAAAASSSPGSSLGATAALAAAACDPGSEGRQGAGVVVTVDNETSAAYSMLTLRCADRKGLLYDLFRSLKDIDLRWATGTCRVLTGSAGALGCIKRGRRLVPVPGGQGRLLILLPSCNPPCCPRPCQPQPTTSCLYPPTLARAAWPTAAWRCMTTGAARWTCLCRREGEGSWRWRPWAAERASCAPPSPPTHTHTQTQAHTHTHTHTHTNPLGAHPPALPLTRILDLPATVQDACCERISDPELLAELMARVRTAV